MRKWVWACFALAVFAGAGVYLAADHTFRHPDSFVGRCAISSLQLTSRIGPVVLQRAVSVAPLRGLSQHRTTCPDKPVCRIHPAPASMPHADSFEAITVEVQPLPESGNIEPVVFSTVNLNRAVQNPTLMPYASDDCDGPHEEVCLLGWFGCEQSCREFFGKFVKAMRVVSGVEEAAQAEVIEVEDVDVEQPSPETLPATPAQGDAYEEIPLGRMQEDPHHHHHYPCCPYTGRCPQPYHTNYPILPRAENTARRTKPEHNSAVPAPVPAVKIPVTNETMDAKPADIKQDESDDSF